MSLQEFGKPKGNWKRVTSDATQVQLLLSQGLTGLLSHTPSTKETQNGL